MQGIQFLTFEDGSTAQETVHLPQIAPNPKDRDLVGRLGVSPSRPTMKRHQETISLNSRDIANYYTEGCKEPRTLVHKPSVDSLAGSLNEAGVAYALGTDSSVNSLSAPRQNAY